MTETVPFFINPTFRLAAQALCLLTLSPQVECLLIDTKGRISGQSYTQRMGFAHAEFTGFA
jgi:pyrimidine deaminase RibD-like protein